VNYATGYRRVASQDSRSPSVGARWQHSRMTEIKWPFLGQEALAAKVLPAGWVIVRVSSELLKHRQGTLVGRVEAAMRAAGWQGGARL